jgi:V/A-type H+-transporting ATPase subunit K
MRVSKKAVSFGLLLLVGVIFCSAWTMAFAQEQATAAAVKDPQLARWAFLSAAIATGLSALAGGIAVAYVGAAAVGAVSEKPEVAGKALIFVGLAEGIAIYGLIIAIMILGRV